MGIFVNSLLSGSMIYPASQTLNVFYIAFVLSFLNFKFHKKNIFMQLFLISILTATIYLQFKNITCVNCMSIGERQAPRFWNYGIGRELVKYDEGRVGQKVESKDY